MNRLFLLPAISTLVATGSSHAHGEDMWLACKSAHDRTVWTDKKTGEKTQDVSRDLPEQTYHYVINSKRVLMKAPDSNEYIVDGDLDEKKTPEIGPSTTSTYFLRISPDTIKFGVDLTSTSDSKELNNVTTTIDRYSGNFISEATSYNFEDALLKYTYNGYCYKDSNTPKF